MVVATLLTKETLNHPSVSLPDSWMNACAGACAVTEKTSCVIRSSDENAHEGMFLMRTGDHYTIDIDEVVALVEIWTEVYSMFLVACFKLIQKSFLD